MLAKETIREPEAYQSPDKAVRDIFGAGIAIQKRQPGMAEPSAPSA